MVVGGGGVTEGAGAWVVLAVFVMDATDGDSEGGPALITWHPVPLDTPHLYLPDASHTTDT